MYAALSNRECWRAEENEAGQNQYRRFSRLKQSMVLKDHREMKTKKE